MLERNTFLNSCVLASDVFAACLMHALTSEREEIMGLLIGDVDNSEKVSRISACVALTRSDKQADRVEISPEQLIEAATHAEKLTEKLGKPMRIVGWYHSHPHITVWPSHVDLKTQAAYQLMDPLFVGLIFSVFNKNPEKQTLYEVTCFQSARSNDNFERKEIKLVFENKRFSAHNLETVSSLPEILAQEVHTSYNENESTKDDVRSLQEEAEADQNLLEIDSKVAIPILECFTETVELLNQRIAVSGLFCNEDENDVTLT